jgi:hypothetical protein
MPSSDAPSASRNAQDAYDTTTTSSLTDLFSGPPPSSPGNDRRMFTVSEPKAQQLAEEAGESSFLIPLKGLSERQDHNLRETLPATDSASTTRCQIDLGLSTWIGSFTALLYHTVFCLAHSAALVRPNADHSSMGVLAQMAALGVCTAGASFIYQTGAYVPAAYPSSDLFLAPFLAVMAKEVDAVLAQHSLQNNDAVFFATFGSLVATAMLLGGILSVLAARIKLANLGVSSAQTTRDLRSIHHSLTLNPTRRTFCPTQF